MSQWIRAHDGTLINLTHVISLRVREQEGRADAAARYEVVASLAGGGMVRINSGRAEAECREWLHDLARHHLEVIDW